ncbi:MAG: hypothetical protein M3539_16390 [Acidobacteriota bacterium]|nr:hypothetical protein [Acidobacteriota bacterium]
MDAPAPGAVREDWLLKTLLGRGLLRVMSLRLNYIRGLSSRTHLVLTRQREDAFLDLICNLWTLVENLLAAYEAVVNKLEIKGPGDRKNVQSRVGGRTAPPGVRFHKAIWFYRSLRETPDQEFLVRGLEPSPSRRTLEGLIERSCAVLQKDYERLREFRERYEPFATAYKHGRAVFHLHLGEKSADEFTLAHDDKALTVFDIDEKSGTETVIELAMDDEAETDCREILEIVENQIPRLKSFFDSLVEACKGFAEWLEVGQPEGQRTTIYLNFFVDYTSEEASLLASLRSKPTS